MSRRNWTSLRQRADFLHLQQQGHKWVTPAFVLNAIRHQNDKPAEVGFTVTKKTGNAVIRNRIRRRLRAVTDQVVGNGADFYGWRLSFLGRGDALDKPFEGLAKDLRWALRRLQGVMDESGQKDKDVVV